MKIVDYGVSKDSIMDFFHPSTFALKTLYFTQQFGHFYCNNKYSIRRDYLDAFLLIYMTKGSLFINTRETQLELTQHQIALIDCKFPHAYSASDYADFSWIHYNGNSSQDYYDYLYKNNGLMFSGKHIHSLKKYFELIISMRQSLLLNEHIVSSTIHTILSQLASPPHQTVTSTSILGPALEYIHNHYHQNVTLEAMAIACNMSVSHMIRTFKKHTDTTPHEYLLAYRLRQAKHLLLTTGDTIETIAEKCGFNSPSHFARAFRTAENLTPRHFKQLHT